MDYPNPNPHPKQPNHCLGVVHFRVVHRGSPWTGGQCFVHYLLAITLRLYYKVVFNEGKVVPWESFYLLVKNEKCDVFLFARIQLPQV